MGSWWKCLALSNRQSTIVAQYWAPFAQQVRQALARLLPQSCFMCGAGAQTLLCSACAHSLPRLPTDCCAICAHPSPGSAICGSCLKKPPHFDNTHATYRYAFPLDRLIQAYKYQHRLALSACFSPTLISPSDADAIIAVPATTAHLRERGFNPALELARPLAKALKLPLLHAAVSRPRDGIAQASLPWSARQKNIRHAFECHVDLSGMRILVVDDVMTTGATLNELARVLKAHGAVHVENRVIARAVKNDGRL